MEAVVSVCVLQYIPLSSYLHLQTFIAMSLLKDLQLLWRINIGSSLGLLPVILSLPCVTEILWLWNSRAGPLTCSQMIHILGWANSEP